MNQGCYGLRAGSEYETGITITGALSNHWFMFLDYRLVADTSGGLVTPANAPGVTNPAALPQPTLLTHVLLLRIEARYSSGSSTTNLAPARGALSTAMAPSCASMMRRTM